MRTIKHDVFISYRRDGGEYTAKILRDRLDELGYAVFFDVESLRSGDFNTKLYSVIEECKDFILILSPGALDRCRNEDDWVRREVEYALERGKNIVPVMLRGFEFPEALPSSMEQLRFKNGIPANTEFFEAFIQKLQSFLRAKPPFWRRITQNAVFKRTLPVFLALALMLPAWASYFASKASLCNFRYNYENHCRMTVLLTRMRDRLTALKDVEQEIPIEALSMLAEEIAEIMLIEDAAPWREQHMGAAVKHM